MQTVSVSDFLKKKFVGVDELRRELQDILEQLHREEREVVITQHGEPKAVLIDLNTYLELKDIQEDVIQPGYIESLYKELKKVQEGKGIGHKELVRKLRL